MSVNSASRRLVEVRGRTFETRGRETATMMACAVWMMPSVECSSKLLVAYETYWYTVVCRGS